MKKGAIIRLVIWSIVALVLTAILTVSLLAGSVSTDFDFENELGRDWYIGIMGDIYPDADEYTVLESSTTLTDNITDITIDWTSGTILIEAYDGDRVEISETEPEKESRRLRYRVKDGVLDIKHQKSAIFFGFGTSIKKDLTVKIPKAMAQQMKSVSLDTASANTEIKGVMLSHKLDIDTASGSVTLDGVSTASVDFDGASGGLTCKNCEVTELSADTVSGNINLVGNVTEVDIDSTSGDVNISSSSLPLSINADTVSGDFVLTVPENDGFSAEFDSVSGKFNCDFETTLDDGEYIHKNGSAEYQFESVSGDITVKNYRK